MRPAVAAFLIASAILGFSGRSWMAAVPRREAVAASQSPAKPAATQPSAKKEHMFRGTIVKVDAGARTLIVNGENVPGWMATMTMTYRVDGAAMPPLKPGDHIIAKVYDGNFTTLYEVRAVSAPSENANQLPALSYVCNTQGQDVLELRPKPPSSRTSRENVRNQARPLSRFASSPSIHVSRSSRSSRKSRAFVRWIRANSSPSRQRSTSPARAIRMSTSSGPEPAPMAVRESEPLNAALMAITTRVTAASFSWPKTTGTILKARSCGPISSGPIFTTTSVVPWPPLAFPRRSPGPMPAAKTWPRPLRSGRDEPEIATHSRH